MKNFMKKVMVTFTAMFMVSSMVIGASAASTAGAACTGNNALTKVCSVPGGSNCIGRINGNDVNSLLGAQDILGNLTPTNNTSNCNTAGATSKVTSAENAVKSYPNCAKQNSTNTTANTGKNCTNKSDVLSAKTANKAVDNCNGSTCATANCNCTKDDCKCTAAECNENKCTTSNCKVKAADTKASFAGTGKPCGILFSNGTNTRPTNSSLVNRINSVLAKCGIELKKFSIPQSGDIVPTATPTPNAGTTPTATPTPNAGTTPTATPTPNAGTTPTATPAPSTGTTPTATPVPSTGITPTATPAPSNTPNTGSANNGSIDNQSFEQQVVTLVNEQRAANGLAPLTLNAQLSNVARTKSQDMSDNNYFSHTSPTYGSPFDMLKTFGVSYRTAGENIAMGYATPQAVVTGWMNSAGHRANILNASFTQIGVGYVANGNYWTQMFIG